MKRYIKLSGILGIAALILGSSACLNSADQDDLLAGGKGKGDDSEKQFPLKKGAKLKAKVVSEASQQTVLMDKIGNSIKDTSGNPIEMPWISDSWAEAIYDFTYQGKAATAKLTIPAGQKGRDIELELVEDGYNSDKAEDTYYAYAKLTVPQVGDRLRLLIDRVENNVASASVRYYSRPTKVSIEGKNLVAREFITATITDVILDDANNQYQLRANMNQSLKKPFTKKVGEEICLSIIPPQYNKEFFWTDGKSEKNDDYFPGQVYVGGTGGLCLEYPEVIANAKRIKAESEKDDGNNSDIFLKGEPVALDGDMLLGMKVDFWFPGLINIVDKLGVATYEGNPVFVADGKTFYQKFGRAKLEMRVWVVDEPGPCGPVDKFILVSPTGNTCE